MKILLRTLVAVMVVAVAAIVVLYLTAPSADTDKTHFDAIIVLGYPAKADGAPEPKKQTRKQKTKHKNKTNDAAHIIMTGGAAHNKFIEADVMARLAQANGVPASAILHERAARNTIENAGYSVMIMQEQGWRSAVVITTPAHGPRSGVIFSVYSIAWRTHAAPWLAEYTFLDKAVRYGYEAQATARLRLSRPPILH